MICPHCQVTFFEYNKTNYKNIVETSISEHAVRYEVCPACNKVTIFLKNIFSRSQPNEITQVFPYLNQKALPSCVPDDLAKDFQEAFAIQTLSPKGSAALSRRCLEILLTDYMHCTGRDLNQKIDDLLAKKILPPYLAHDVDAIRSIGNFAAHPIKSNQSGEIVEVEKAEVDWQLQILEALFDFQFVHPQQAEERRNSFNSKLEESGKPTLKVPT